MQTFSFGARDNSIIQFAYTVDDITRECDAIRTFSGSGRGF